VLHPMQRQPMVRKQPAKLSQLSLAGQMRAKVERNVSERLEFATQKEVISRQT